MNARQLSYDDFDSADVAYYREQSITGYRRAIALAEAIDSDQLAVLYNRLATALANDSTDLDEAVKLSGKSFGSWKNRKEGRVYVYPCKYLCEKR